MVHVALQNLEELAPQNLVLLFWALGFPEISGTSWRHASQSLQGHTHGASQSRVHQMNPHGIVINSI